jgi:tight adherence protein C
MYGLANSLAIVPVIIVFAATAYYYFGTVTEKKILKRSEEMLSDFSNVVSKLALLTNAGMIMREAWEEVAYTGETTLYKEMQKAERTKYNGCCCPVCFLPLHSYRHCRWRTFHQSSDSERS